MDADLADLRIAPKEIEGLTGLEVNDLFIGGAISGTYRPSLFQNPRRLVAFAMTQLFIAALTFIFTVPIGLWMIRSAPGAISDFPTVLPFLLGTSGTTAVVVAVWNIHMVLKARSLRTLAHLLDEVDRYNDVIQAIEVLDKLEAIGSRQAIASNREPILEALNLTRKSLVCGLMTERILRQNRKLLARRYELFASIESNLIALKTLEVNNQANEYAELLNEALQIGAIVHREVEKISETGHG